MTPAARGAGSSARPRERGVHVDGDGDGDAAAISSQGLCDRLFAFFHVFFVRSVEVSNCLVQTFCSNLNLQGNLHVGIASLGYEVSLRAYDRPNQTGGPGRA